MNDTPTVCPRCGRAYTEPPAISRMDGTTEICPRCGTLEAVTAAGLDADTVAEILRTIDTAQQTAGK